MPNTSVPSPKLEQPESSTTTPSAGPILLVQKLMNEGMSATDAMDQVRSLLSSPTTSNKNIHVTVPKHIQQLPVIQLSDDYSTVLNLIFAINKLNIPPAMKIETLDSKLPPAQRARILNELPTDWKEFYKVVIYTFVLPLLLV